MFYVPWPAQPISSWLANFYILIKYYKTKKYITPEAYKRNTGLMLAQCCTRWANIRHTLAQRTMFADIVAKQIRVKNNIHTKANTNNKFKTFDIKGLQFTFSLSLGSYMPVV